MREENKGIAMNQSMEVGMKLLGIIGHDLEPLDKLLAAIFV
jgi:hypothetical protein